MPISALSHVSLGTNDFPRAKAFYDQVLATIGIRCVYDHEGGAGYGRQFPEFWIQAPHDGGRASCGNGVHVCFFAATQEDVQAFHAKAVELGGKSDGEPGTRAEYSPDYYAAFVRDPDGNKIEAMVAVKGV